MDLVAANLLEIPTQHHVLVGILALYIDIATLHEQTMCHIHINWNKWKDQ